MSNSISGYNGIIKSPVDTINYSTPMYCICDNNIFDLYILLLYPGFYNDAINICRKVSNTMITFFIPSLETTYIDDLITLINEIASLKNNNIKWCYPTRTSYDFPYNFRNNQIKKSIIFNKFNSDISIEYIESINGDSSLFDIIIRDGIKTKYFCQYLTEEKLNSLFDNKQINEVHLQYKNSTYGGLSYIDAINISHKYKNKLVAHSFNSLEEYAAAKNNFEIVGKINIVSSVNYNTTDEEIITMYAKTELSMLFGRVDNSIIYISNIPIIKVTDEGEEYNDWGFVIRFELNFETKTIPVVELYDHLTASSIPISSINTVLNGYIYDVYIDDTQSEFGLGNIDGDVCIRLTDMINEAGYTYNDIYHQFAPIELTVEVEDIWNE